MNGCLSSRSSLPQAAPTAPAAQVAERRADERSSVGCSFAATAREPRFPKPQVAPWGQFRDVIREEMCTGLVMVA